VPVNVTVGVDAAVLNAAVSVVVCAVPGVSVSAAGLAVTPAVSPVIATATVPVKPFVAVARTLTEEPVAAAAMVRDVGETPNEKSGGRAAATTVRAIVAECANAPEVPVKVTVALPAVALEAAASVTF